MLFIVDFDGTVAPTDTVDALLERFADPEWRRIEERWVRGEINSQQCMAAQIALVAGESATLEEFFRSVAIDPSFADFVRYVGAFSEVAVVSDGLDYPIRLALEKLDLPITIHANAVQFRPGGLSITFPHNQGSCIVGSGVCKCAIARSLDGGRGGPVILVGDGRSDLCIARMADHVFAKSTLLKFCEKENIRHTPFSTFRDVEDAVREWYATESVASAEVVNVQ